MALIFVAITIMRHQRQIPSPSYDHEMGQMTDERKEKLSRFWSTFNRAESLRISGLVSEAIGAYEKALKIDSSHQSSLYWQGNLLSDAGDDRGARAVFERLLQVNPMSSRAHQRLGHILSTFQPGGEIDAGRAEDHFRAALEINSEESGPYYLLGRLLLCEGDFEGSRHRLFNALRINPNFLEAHRLLGYSFLLEGLYERAAHHYYQALEIGTQAPVSAVPGEGDTKQSLKGQTAISPKNISALFGLAVTSYLGTGYPDYVDKYTQIKLPNCVQRLNITQIAPSSTAGFLATSLVWSDYDRDGDPDLFQVSPHSQLTLWNNEGNRSFQDATAIAGLGNAPRGWKVYTYDLDNDQDEDIVILNSGWWQRGGCQTWENVNGTFQLSEVWEIPLNGWVTGLVITDLNNDEKTDIIDYGMDSTGNPRIRHLTFNNGTWVVSNNIPLSTEGGIPVDCAVGDIDHDSQSELYVVCWRGVSSLLQIDECGQWHDIQKARGIESSQSDISAVFFDFNNDSQLDLFVGVCAPYENALQSLLDIGENSQKHRPRLYINIGNGVFRQVVAGDALDKCFGMLDVSSCDWNNDGLTDLYVCNGGFEVGRFEPDAVLLNRNGTALECEYVHYLPGKSYSFMYSGMYPDSESLLGVGRGGILSGEQQPSVLYVILQKKGQTSDDVTKE